MDATERSLAKFKNPAHWDRTAEDVPIFRCHECYRRDTGKKEPERRPDGSPNPHAGRPIFDTAVVEPGAKPDGKGWVLAYSIDEEALHDVADEITRLWKDDFCPLKLFAGHSSSPATTPQAKQPPLIGYGVGGAYVGKWGGKNVPAVMMRRQVISKGYGSLADELPERSPEFYPGTNQIKAVALLKTDPRLNMGFTIYQRPDGAVLYGRGFDAMPGTAPDPTKVPPSAAEEKVPPPSKPEEEESPEAPGSWEHMQKHHPELYGLCQKMGYGALPQAGAPPSLPATPTPGPTHMGKTNTPATPGDGNFAENVHKMQREHDLARIKALEEVNATKDCEAILYGLVKEGYYIKDPVKERDKLLRMSPAERIERTTEIRENYQRDPAAGDWVQVDETPLAGAGGVSDAQTAQLTPSDMNKIVQYCETNKLDYENDEHRRRAMTAVSQMKRRR